MNKQVQMLAEQSGFRFYDTKVAEEITKSGQINIQKFAELLIESVLEQVKIGFDPIDIKQFYKE